MGKDKSMAKTVARSVSKSAVAPSAPANKSSRAVSPSPSTSSSASSSSSSSSSGSSSYDSDSSNDTIEDEDGEELTPAMDAAILRTLAKIRRKEAGVYGGERILDAELAAAQAEAGRRGLAERAAARSEKPFLLKDLHRQNLLEGVDSDDDEAGEYREEDMTMTNAEAARRARDDAVSAFAKFAEDSDEGADDDEEEDAGGPKRRAKDADEEAADAAAYRQFLLEMGGGETEVRAALGMADAPVTDFREDVDLDDAASLSAKQADTEVSEKKRAKREAKRRAKRAQADEDFLMDYILNRGWIDSEKKAVPTYDEIVGRPRGEDGGEDEEASGDEHPWGKLDEEDEFDDKADEFETEYNFRFEEPGSSRIITHPRQIDNAVRRGDDSRKLKRAARAERKAAEKAAREEETKRLKGQKRREMGAQLEALKRELGEEGVDWAAVEKVLEGEWDEAEWERVVGAMLAAKDAAEDGGEDDDDVKPTWDDGLGDEYLSGNDDDDDGDAELDADDAAYAVGGGDGDVEMEWPTDAWANDPDLDDDDDAPINMDADFDGVDEPKRGKKESKKERKRRRAAEAAAAAAAAGGPETSGMTVAERAEKMKAAADELRGLDHEDEVGGLRTRFKYTRTAPQSFGLTPAEILLATDAELNALVSLKHMQPYRRRGIGRAGIGLGRRVRDLKAKLARRRWGEDEEDDKGQGKRAFHIERQGPGGANALALGKRRRADSDATTATAASAGDKKRAGKRLGRKERLKAAAAAGGSTAQDAEAPEPEPVPEPQAKRRKTLDAEPAPAPVDEVPAPEGKKRARKKKKRTAVE